MEDAFTIATQFINSTSSHLFLTGKAGTGKTTFLKNLAQLTYKSFIILAPTGIAALNAGGVTIHSQFLLPPRTFLPDRDTPIDESGRYINQDILASKYPLDGVRKKLLSTIDLVVIDEVSMLRADLLDAIDYRMRTVRRNFSRSFGGVQVVFIGDLYQLSPVVKKDEWDKLKQYYKGIWFYEAKALQGNNLVYIELEKIFRQSDQKFISVLNTIRNNAVTQEHVQILNQCVLNQPRDLSEIIRITTHNFRAHEINQKELHQLKTPSYFFDAHVEGEFPESMYPVVSKLELKVGAQVMFVRNDTEGKMYYNGKLATVTQIEEDHVVWVKMAASNQRFQLKNERWENKKYTLDEEGNLNEQVIGVFEQFPIRLAWAITVHKSQGLTFDKAIIDVAESFTHGQVYVALSRLRSLEGLILTAPINKQMIMVDQEVAIFSKRSYCPERLPQLMQEQQQDFICLWIDSTFELLPLVQEIQNSSFCKKNTDSVLSQLAHSLEIEYSNIEKLRNRLKEYALSEHTPKLLDLLARASRYYKHYLEQQTSILVEHLEIRKKEKRVKTYIAYLTEIDQMLAKKIAKIDESLLLIQGILKGEKKINFKQLTEQRMLERDKLLEQIREKVALLPINKNKTKPEKTPSMDITVGMLNTGMSIEQIAQERNLKIQTIDTHLTNAIQKGKASVFTFISENDVIHIINAHRALPEQATLKTLFESLNGKFRYGQLQAVMAYLKKQ